MFQTAMSLVRLQSPVQSIHHACVNLYLQQSHFQNSMYKTSILPLHFICLCSHDCFCIKMHVISFKFISFILYCIDHYIDFLNIIYRISYLKFYLRIKKKCYKGILAEHQTEQLTLTSETYERRGTVSSPLWRILDDVNLHRFQQLPGQPF